MKSLHEKALEKAKVALMLRPDSVFFSELVFSLKYHWDESYPTAATDGIHMWINPVWFMDMNPEQQLGLLLHETMHGVYLHTIRRNNRDPEIWNSAADHVINLMLLERGFKLPDGGCCDTRFKNMTTEQVYDILKKEADKIPNKPKTVPGIGQDLVEPDSKESDATGATAEEIEAHVTNALVRASIRSQQENDKPGTIPGDIQIFLNGLLKPKLPWNRILQKYLNSYSKNDYSFKKPNKRFFPAHYLPSMYSINLMEIAIAVDTSGSVSDEEFHQFISEIHTIFRMMKPPKIHLIQFDTKLKEVREIKDLRDMSKIKFTGRGGTEIGGLVNWVNTNKPKLLLVFTDGAFNFKNYHTDQNTIWVIHNNPRFAPQFGKAIHYGI